MMTDKWLVVANAGYLNRKLFHSLKKNASVLVCDGACDVFNDDLSAIDVVLGDWDSIDPACLAKIKQCQSIQCVDALDQSATDLEKAMIYLDQQRASSISVLSAVGARFDHTFYNIRLLKHYYSANRPIVFYTDHEIIQYVHNETITLSGKVGDCISIFGCDQAIVTASGLKYKLNKTLLGGPNRDSISNVFSSISAHIEVEGAAVVILTVA